MNIKRKLVSPVLMWLVVATGVFIAFQLVPARFLFPRNMFTSFLILPAMAYWLYFFIGAVKAHSQAAFSTDKISRIIKEGIYAKVRHPIYAADIILGWSILLFYPDARFLTGAIWLTAVLFFWMRLEERALIEKFGEEYREYRRRVPPVFPKF